MCKNVEKHNKEICRLEYWVVGGEMFQPQTSDTGSSETLQNGNDVLDVLINTIRGDNNIIHEI